ncbi:MAG: flagellar basal body-associated protein FliL [Helicobacteraceae bacterium]|nr:flagellar basal body-associated protein FliL [Helicobacteraceae bacterium]
MAEEEEAEGQEGKEEVKETSGEKKSPMMMIIIAVVVVLLILIGAIVFVLMSGDEEDLAAPTTVAQQATGTQSKSVVTATSSNMGPAIPFSEMGALFPLDSFTINLTSNAGKRYLKIEMSLELSDPAVAAELDTRQAAIRDLIIRLLSSKSLEEISTTKGKDKLKGQIIGELNMRLKDGKINNIYFTTFVIQ